MNTASAQFAAFCFVLAMIVRWFMNVTGKLQRSAMKAVHARFFDVARILAEPLPKIPPRFDCIPIPGSAGVDVPKTTVAPGATLKEVGAASFTAGPPALKKSSTPTRIVAVSIEVHEK